MSVNRLKPFLQEPEEPDVPGDYFCVCARYGTFFVARETAERIARQLEQDPLPRWIRFRDLFGAEIGVQCQDIRCITESTGSLRQAAREFRRARRQEDRAERRPWEDDDWW